MKQVNKNLFKTALLASIMSTSALAQWTGTNPLLTNSSVGIGNGISGGVPAASLQVAAWNPSFQLL